MRKPNDPKQNRGNYISAKITDHELELVKKMASSDERTVSDFLRILILHESERRGLRDKELA